MEVGVECNDTVNTYDVIQTQDGDVNAADYVCRLVIDRVDEADFVFTGSLSRTSYGPGNVAKVNIISNVQHFGVDQPAQIKLRITFNIDDAGETVSTVVVPFVKTRKY
jgi:hypothetical protein